MLCGYQRESKIIVMVFDFEFSLNYFHNLKWFSTNCLQTDSNPDGQDLERIANTTGLSKRVTQVWFQNSRARQKKHLNKNRVPIVGESVINSRLLGNGSSIASIGQGGTRGSIGGNGGGIGGGGGNINGGNVHNSISGIGTSSGNTSGSSWGGNTVGEIHSNSNQSWSLSNAHCSDGNSN